MTEFENLCLPDRREDDETIPRKRPWMDLGEEYFPCVDLETHEVNESTIRKWFKSVPRQASWSDDEWLEYRLLQAGSMLPTCLEVTPKKRGGIPVIKGTRFTAAQVIAEIADGRSVSQLCATFELDEVAVTVFLRALSIYLDRPAPSSAYANFSTGRMLK